MNIKLSKRLQQIADWVPAGSRLADIGSDHALLPAYLAEQQRIEMAVAGEVNQGPYEAACRQIEGARLAHRVSVRRGDGLAVISPGEVDVISIAGMGGGLIVQILAADPGKLAGVTRLVLQPNVGEAHVRAWLRREGWNLMEEALIEEDGKLYEVLLAERARSKEEAVQHDRRLYAPRELNEQVTLTEEWLVQLGPMLSAAPTPEFKKKWQLEIRKRARILRTMEQAATEEARQRRAMFADSLAQLEAILACMHTRKP